MSSRAEKAAALRAKILAKSASRMNAVTSGDQYELTANQESIIQQAMDQTDANNNNNNNTVITSTNTNTNTNTSIPSSPLTPFIDPILSDNIFNNNNLNTMDPNQLLQQLLFNNSTNINAPIANNKPINTTVNKLLLQLLSLGTVLSILLGIACSINLFPSRLDIFLLLQLGYYSAIYILQSILGAANTVNNSTSSNSILSLLSVFGNNIPYLNLIKSLFQFYNLIQFISTIFNQFCIFIFTLAITESILIITGIKSAVQ